MRFWPVNRAVITTEEFADAYDVVRALLTDRGPEDLGMASARTERMLRHYHALGETRHWSTLADEAEHHGIASLIEPLIGALGRNAPELVPDDVRLAFMALARRHRRAAAAREACIDELLAACDDAGIQIVLLKGAALGHLIYPAPEVRAMIDIDVLIDPADAKRSVQIARSLGYSFASKYGSRFAGRMHHLPVASTTRSGFRIPLEIHTEALSPNQRGNLSLASLVDELQPFSRDHGPGGMALGHLDMLRHLARHAFEPARRIRLIHLYDLWRYQAKFRDEIDWQELEARFPDVVVILRLVSQVFTRPSTYPREAQADPVPAGVGLGMMPLAEIAHADMSLRAKLAAVFNPPAWWLHGFYGVAPERSLFACRSLRHPIRVSRWVAERLAAGSGVGVRDPLTLGPRQECGVAEVNR